MKPLKDIVLDHLDQEKSEDFAEWAFGPDYMTLHKSLAFMNRWNTLHGHEMHLSGDGKIDDDIKRMVTLWDSKK